jgi:hypothetical protein
VATLIDQVSWKGYTVSLIRKGYCVVIGSPDKQLKQVISEDVQLVIPTLRLAGILFMY